MGAIKSVARHGKYLEIVIKKPLFRNYNKYLDKIIKIFSDAEHGEEYLSTFWDPAITENKDIKLTFILRNYADIEPYIEQAKALKQSIKNIRKAYKKKIKNLEWVNRNLVALCEAYEKEHNSTFQEWQELILEKRPDYKTRVEKALQRLAEKQKKFINDPGCIIDDLDIDEIMKILEGQK